MPTETLLHLGAVAAAAGLLLPHLHRMELLVQSPAAVSWTLITLAVLSAAASGKVCLGVLRAYYTLRVRAGVPVVLWFPKFWRMDGRRQTGSSLLRVLKRMERLRGPHGMYGTVFGTQAVLHVADPEAAALVLSQHTKRPGYDHFGGFFGRGVFTADGEEWRRKRTSVAHALFRGSAAPGGSRGSASRAVGGQSGETSGGAGGGGDGGGNSGGGSGNSGGGGGGGGGGGEKSLVVLANEEADALLAEVEALWQGGGGEVEVEMVRLLQRHTLNLIHRFLCAGEDVCASPERRRLLPRYLDAVTDMRMVILARSRSVWMLAWSWAYRAFSPLYAREARNMAPIREFAGLVLETALRSSGGHQVSAHECSSSSSGHNDDSDNSSGGSSSCGRGVPGVGSGISCGGPIGSGGRQGGAVGRKRASPPRVGQEAGEEGDGGGDTEGSDHRPAGTASAGARVVKEPCTALFSLAARESHRAYPGSMLDETITLLFAGQDTSAATLSWTMHLLSLPENRLYLAEIRREVMEAGGPDGYVECGGSSKSSLPGGGGAGGADGGRADDRRQPRLPMVDACIRESQRLYPVAPFVVRHLTSDLRLKDGTMLPAGALACVWIYGLHRHPALWESPDAFLPERWLDGAKQPPGAFIPYASGPRGCVGRPFAVVALRILLARLCAALDFAPAAAGDTDSIPAGVPDEAGAAVAAVVAAAAGTKVVTPPPSGSGVDLHAGFPEEEGGGDVGRSQRRGGLQRGGRGGVVGGGPGGRASKEMQAGFTVLPGGGVHLRLREWRKEE